MWRPEDIGSPFGAPVEVGRIALKDIDESSGLAASRCTPGVLWTMNDSDNGPYIFAIDETGSNLGTWRVTGAVNRDWEDIAAFKDADGKCYLYIGDIGNNEGKRGPATIYRVAEPAVNAEARDTTIAKPLETDAAAVITVNFRGVRPNAETLMVHPMTGDIYIATKRLDGPSAVYRVRAGPASPALAAEAERVGEISVPSIPNGFLTGGDISPDGRRLVVCDYLAAYELRLPDGDDDFDHIWGQPPVKFYAGDRKEGESIAYSADGKRLLTGSEGKHSPIFAIGRK